MTTEEAIAYFEARRNYNPHDGNPEAERLAIYALRAQQQAEANEPLTMDELRKMEGEPVWVVLGEGGCLKIVDIIYMAGNKEIILFNDKSSYMLAGYGKTWLAYRHKPKAHTTTCTATNQPCSMCQSGPCGSREEAHNGSN